MFECYGFLGCFIDVRQYLHSLLCATLLSGGHGRRLKATEVPCSTVPWQRLQLEGADQLTWPAMCPLQMATQAQQVMMACEKSRGNAVQLDYDPRNPFDVCSLTFTPIYRFACCV